MCPVFERTQLYQQNVLKHIIDIGASLRLHMDIDMLLKRVATATCEALQFRYSALYLSEHAAGFHMRATCGLSAEQEQYLYHHPLPDNTVALLINEEYRASDSYFVPAESPLWQNEAFANLFVITKSSNDGELVSSPSPDLQDNIHWQPKDLLIVPLVSNDDLLLGFLTPNAPLDGLRPTSELLELLELFANQAAVVIEGARLYEEARRNSEERAALIEIGRALSAPDALRDLQTVYQTIYEQVKRTMPADAFFVARYHHAKDETLIIDYLIDEGVMYSSTEYAPFSWERQQVLSQSDAGLLFSTAEKYAAFTSSDAREDDKDLFGNQRPSQSLLFVPIRYGEEAIGILSTQSYQPYAYTERHLKLLKEIGVQAGIAITNARLYADLREAVKLAQESERLKNHFLMTASHELRTPLTAIQGYLELLDMHGLMLDDNEKNRFIANARRACEELILLLGNVMDTGRIDQDHVALNVESVQVLHAVQLILEILEPTIARERRTIEVDIATDLHVWVDDLRLRQILLNIVGNALKYTPSSTKIAISARPIAWNMLYQQLPAPYQRSPLVEREAMVLIAVRDWGAGIALEDQQRLFTKFMRLPSAMNSIQRGAGLGLYLCRQLTEAMDGYIWVESKGIAGEGTTFLIALPQ